MDNTSSFTIGLGVAQRRRIVWLNGIHAWVWVRGLDVLIGRKIAICYHCIVVVVDAVVVPRDFERIRSKVCFAIQAEVRFLRGGKIRDCFENGFYVW